MGCCRDVVAGPRGVGGCASAVPTAALWVQAHRAASGSWAVRYPGLNPHLEAARDGHQVT